MYNPVAIWFFFLSSPSQCTCSSLESDIVVLLLLVEGPSLSPAANRMATKSQVLHSDQNETKITAYLSCSAGRMHFAHTTIVAYLILRRGVEVIDCRFELFFFVESTTFETKKL